MAGNSSKPSSSSTKRPPSSSDHHRRSRWESSSPASSKPSSNPNPNRPNSDTNNNNKPTPKRNPNPNPNPNPSPAHPNPHLPPSLGPPPPPPPPSYGFHMLDRRTIVLADGSVRSYFALPPDYQDFPPPLPPRPDPTGRFMPGGQELGRFGPMSPDGMREREREEQFRRGPGGQDYWNSLGLEGRVGPEGGMKRKFGEGEERERERERERDRQRMHVLQYANAGADMGGGLGTSSPFGREREREDEFRAAKQMRMSGGLENNSNSSNLAGGVRQEVDPAPMRAFYHFVKLVNENANMKKTYLENGKNGSVQCLACGRSSKEFPDVHALVMHSYNSDNARVNHLGLHRALCVLMGWSYKRAPDSSRAYQFLPAEEAAANQDDLILWPPTVIIHNTNTGKGKEGRIEGLGNKTMDSKLRDLGFPTGKSHSLYNREGHRGITLVKFGNDKSGLKEAMRLAEHFEKERHGRREWARVQTVATGRGDGENNSDLVIVDDQTKERKKVLYGYLATASDLDMLDFETRKKVSVESRREKLFN